MVKEYIQNQIRLTEEKISKEKSELQKIHNIEKMLCSEIENVRKSDINFEIFSPRTGEISLRDKLKSFDQKLREVRAERIRKEEALEKLKEEEKIFKQMLEEILEMKNE